MFDTQHRITELMRIRAHGHDTTDDYRDIETLNMYGVKKIVTACPHCFNTLKNEYPALGGTYEVMHHTQFINTLLKEGRIKVEGGEWKSPIVKLWMCWPAAIS